jgi:NAD(P) transhydrogenase subunit alpha
MEHGAGVDPLIFAITVFVLACFVGYYVVWEGNASAAYAAYVNHQCDFQELLWLAQSLPWGQVWAFHPPSDLLPYLSPLSNIFGGFVVTQRMLQMFKKKIIQT